VSVVEIRRAQAGDEAIIVGLLRDLADYERLSEKFRLTTETVTCDFFGAAPAMYCDLAVAGGRPAGIMTWYPTYSSFAATRGIFLEDFYVRADLRGQGIGRKLLAHLARRALDDGAAKIEWAVLTWNRPSIEFYEMLHAERVDDWHIYRLVGDALAALARA
jgi:diamine N-acetyltransferase